MKALQLLLSALCFNIVAALVLPPDAGIGMTFAVSMALVLGVALSANYSVEAHEARDHKEPKE